MQRLRVALVTLAIAFAHESHASRRDRQLAPRARSPYAGKGVADTQLKPTLFIRRVRPEVTGEFLGHWRWRTGRATSTSRSRSARSPCARSACRRLAHGRLLACLRPSARPCPLERFDLTSEVVYVRNETREAVEGFQSRETNPMAIFTASRITRKSDTGHWVIGISTAYRVTAIRLASTGRAPTPWCRCRRCSSS